MKKIRIGSRKSPLALWQAEFIKKQLEDAGLPCVLELMETKGDKVQKVSISKIGSKGVFTEELEEKLESGEIDIAVHSAKDMASRLNPGFELIAFTEREKANDVLVSDRNVSLKDSIVVGTSSTRRVSTLKHFYPHIQIVDMRGNLQTRIQKMRNGDCDALLLAFAGVHRMGFGDMIRQDLSLSEFTPAVGQGSLAIESHERLDADLKNRIRSVLNHEKTERLLIAERTYLKELEGGCSIPVYALCTYAGQVLNLTGGIISLDGKVRIVRTVEGTEPAELGIRLSKEVLENGGKEILAEIKNAL